MNRLFRSAQKFMSCDKGFILPNKYIFCCCYVWKEKLGLWGRSHRNAVTRLIPHDLGNYVVAVRYADMNGMDC